MNALYITSVARFAHEANRAYCAAIGDTSQLPWDQAPEWQKQSAIAGVEFHLANPESTPADSHNSWLAVKREDGWVYGPVKDAEKKEHPCMVAYDELPAEQKAKDYIFLCVVRQLEPLVEALEAKDVTTLELQAKLDTMGLLPEGVHPRTLESVDGEPMTTMKALQLAAELASDSDRVYISRTIEKLKLAR